MSKRVFILGAGCSARYGYPLGLNLVDELHGFLAKIPGGCPVIKSAVEDAVALAAEFPNADTLDKLVNLAEERLMRFKAQEHTFRLTKGYEREEGLTDSQILNAKKATAALFLHREPAARETTLEGYKKDLLPAIFGQGRDWQSAVNGSDCRVLTFNYDRLFEIAFLDYFKDFEPKQFPLYGSLVLNSGFDPMLQFGLKRIQIAPDRFCFLKLHGSAGWWARKCASPPSEKWREHCVMPLQAPTDLLQLERALVQNNGIYPWEPLIAFPHEKQRFTSTRPGDFVQGPYVGKVWADAAAVLGEAAEVTVIGYSFPGIDRAHAIENLLRRVSSETNIMIENKDPEAVRLALDGAEIPGRLHFKERTF